MKKSVLITTTLICYFLFLTSLKSNSQNKTKPDSLYCLQIEGKILNVDAGEDASCIVELISLYNGIDTITLKEGKKKFKFMLEKDTYYALRISKKGYITKLVSINTEIVTTTDGIFRFLFETNLIKVAALKRFNRDIVDFPVAIIYFDYHLDTFSYNKEYSENIKKQLYQLKQDTSSIKAMASVN